MERSYRPRHRMHDIEGSSHEITKIKPRACGLTLLEMLEAFEGFRVDQHASPFRLLGASWQTRRSLRRSKSRRCLWCRLCLWCHLCR